MTMRKPSALVSKPGPIEAPVSFISSNSCHISPHILCLYVSVPERGCSRRTSDLHGVDGGEGRAFVGVRARATRA